jgi:hypothetical protein
VSIAIALQEAIYTALSSDLSGSVYAASPELVANGNFSEPGVWTLGAGWALGATEAYAVDSAGSLSQTLTATAGTMFVKFTLLSRDFGSVSVRVGGVEAISAKTVPGTYTGYATYAGANPLLEIVADAEFSGEVDSVSARKTYVVPVYDDVPDNAPFPYVSFSFQNVDAADFLSERKDSRMIYLSVWSDYRGQREVLQIMEQIYEALHEQRMPLDTGRIAQMRVVGRDTNREPDGVTYMGRVRVMVFTET